VNEIKFPETIGDQILYNSSKFSDAVWLVSPETGQSISFREVNETIFFEKLTKLLPQLVKN